MATLSSATGTIGATSSLYSGFAVGIGQSFSFTRPALLDSIAFSIRKVGAPTGNFTYNVYNITGFPGTTAIPNGTPLYTLTAAASALPTTPAFGTLNFASRVILPGGSYMITAEYTGGDSSNYIEVGAISPRTDTSQNYAFKNSTTWTPNTPVTYAYIISGDFAVRTSVEGRIDSNLRAQPDPTTYNFVFPGGYGAGYAGAQYGGLGDVPFPVVTFTGSHSIDTIKKKQPLNTHSIDTIKLKRTNKTHSIDTILKKQPIRIHSIDAVKLKRIAKTHSIDTVLKKTPLRTHSVDSLLKKSFTRAHSVDGFFVGRRVRVHTVDSLLKKSYLRTHSIDTLLKKTVTKTHSIDSVTRAGGINKIHSIDTKLRKTVNKTHSIDAPLAKLYTRSHSIDTVKKKRYTKTHTVDALLKKRFTRVHSLDGFFRKSVIRTHSIDSNLKKNFARSTSIDTVLKKRLSLSHTIDYRLKSRFNKTQSIDGIFKKTNTKTHSIDTVIIRRISRTHTIDSFFKKRSIRTHSIDGALKLPSLRRHTIDTIIKSANYASKPITAVKPSTPVTGVRDYAGGDTGTIANRPVTIASSKPPRTDVKISTPKHSIQ